MKHSAEENRGFTLVELLTVLAIITMLIGMLVPALNTVRRFAKETKQKAQLASIDAALVTFRNDYGDYPPSRNFSEDTGAQNYCGALKLCEALLGRDLMGFHPGSTWSATDNTFYNPGTLGERKSRYLELATTNAFRLGDLYADTGNLRNETFVLCDAFTTKKITVGGKTAKAGAPILYYRANTASTSLETPAANERIYNYMHNQELIGLKDFDDDGVLGEHPLGDTTGAYFYTYITDPKIVDTAWPHRPDSYLLITAGADGLYGTADDICNFEPNVQP